MKKFTKKHLIFVSFMLFSMFFGAGNLIFPAFLGFSAGEHVWISLTGFILSAVGLPILGVAAVAKAGSFQTLARRVHPVFAFIFPLIIYLSIGPGLAIPRAGSLAFEMGAGPLLPEDWATAPAVLLIYTAIFFGLVFWLSLSPSKLVDRFGKLLTPIVLTLIFIIFIKSLTMPTSATGTPQGDYGPNPFFQGFLDGYLTMDALASLVFGIVVANTLRAKGVENKKTLSTCVMYAGFGAGLLLAAIYLILGFLGAYGGPYGQVENGAQVLTHVMAHLFGQSGTILLSVVFTLACLCVSIGLVTSCSQFFTSVFPRVPYKTWAIIFCVWSMATANLGLTEILNVSVPILGAIYPVAIVLIVLALVHDYIRSYSSIYIVTVTFVGLFSMVDMINTAFLAHKWNMVLVKFPLYAHGIGWLVPALAGVIIGYTIDLMKHPGKRAPVEKEAA
ncbi:branched-chain amino acid transport system II carrier protein [Aneurinibacillus thermoaerophilus]|uniref:Branched-chain amino acid transport system carrier protein n=1 Tax=Aneurinibacillus thermoaerophilus TaxID=143495 RepID=A0ABX8Y8H6_ANETH|nr:branched-chain amino acid transport system II carrier protein [Aneurinibacillus thermoaerophilus]MED0675200.1 branched-chain amino acid transport system II carrier protein [Aneurinibacillus thermoaerophilus]MED0680104.1 branched-chain amino acid transport system II carrier protein [Aneurinibacillus thermoaerophilus]MED0738138.1 branched-chain amino acid transport system II carrier protein [Aneurinibacillus thermoaerophilus]MED0758244.1 branched-chain amino acid transport system II carrier pr